MQNGEWITLIESKKKELVEKGMKAYRKAVECRYSDYVVTIYKDGDIYEYEFIHNSGSTTFGCHTGTQHEVIRFHFDEPIFNEVDEYELISRLEKIMSKEEIDELKQLAEEEQTSIEVVCINSSNELVNACYRELYKEESEFYISEYGALAVDEQIENNIEMLSCNE